MNGIVLLRVIEILLENRAEISAKDNYGLTPLHLAASRFAGSETIAPLLKSGTGPYLEINDGGSACLTLRLRLDHDY